MRYEESKARLGLICKHRLGYPFCDLGCYQTLMQYPSAKQSPSTRDTSHPWLERFYPLPHLSENKCTPMDKLSEDVSLLAAATVKVRSC